MGVPPSTDYTAMAGAGGSLEEASETTLKRGRGYVLFVCLFVFVNLAADFGFDYMGGLIALADPDSLQAIPADLAPLFAECKHGACTFRLLRFCVFHHSSCELWAYPSTSADVITTTEGFLKINELGWLKTHSNKHERMNVLSPHQQ